MTGFTTFDIAMLLVIGIAAVLGAMRGLVAEVTSLAAWVAGVLAVRLFLTPAQQLAGAVTGSPAAAMLLAYAGLFLLAFGTVRLLGSQLSRGVKASAIGPLDRLLGFGFGLTKGLLAGGLVFLAVSFGSNLLTPGRLPQWLAQSRTTPLLALMAGVMVDVARDNAADPHAGLGDDGPAGNGDNATGDDAGDDGYSPEQRKSLDDLLDTQEKQSPGTKI
jgi:membrane protein required for colicin V production